MIEQNRTYKGNFAMPFLGEMADHLGNVRSVVSDVRIASYDPATTTITNTADVKDFSEYYPFGMRINSLSLNSNTVEEGGYKFGFQGEEKLDEWTGTSGTIYDYKYRVHDTRIGRFLSIDPLYRGYPGNSTYAFSMNRVIDGIELEGLEYLDKDEALVEMFAGAALIKLENFSKIYQNAFEKKYPNHGLVSIDYRGIAVDGDRILATVIHPEFSGAAKKPSTQQKGYAARFGTYEVKTGTPIKGVPNQTVRIGYSSSIKGFKGTSSGAAFMFALNAINIGVEFYINNTLYNDFGKLSRQTKNQTKYFPDGLFSPLKSVEFEAPFLLAQEDMNEALEKNVIPEKYRNTEDLSNIFNIVLYGGAGNESNEIKEIANKIIETISTERLKNYEEQQKKWEKEVE